MNMYILYMVQKNNTNTGPYYRLSASFMYGVCYCNRQPAEIWLEKLAELPAAPATVEGGGGARRASSARNATGFDEDSDSDDGKQM